MSLDTKYRPTRYEHVLGQEGSVQILQGYIRSGAGFHQSYLFAGPFGSGKTTLGRILARALLCAKPVEGAPCDECVSCRSILEGGTSENFVEIDAATNSGKDSIRRIVEEISYSTFSGKQRIYLFDESHRLSADALDALLKPMEDCVPGSQDKSLICIFCTTEPERMRATILSRCAPAFVIRPVSPKVIATRLAEVCDLEKIEYETEALELIGELTECHIRDALKAIEGVSQVGKVNRENVAKVLRLDSHLVALEILGALATDLPTALGKTVKLLENTSPTTVYERLANTAMLTFQVGIGIASAPSFWDLEKLREIGKKEGPRLLSYVDRFSSRPGYPSRAMVLCDVAQLHQEVNAPPPVVYLPGTISSPEVSTKDPGKVEVEDQPKTVDGVYVHPRAIRGVSDTPSHPPPQTPPPAMKPLEFFRLVKIRADELTSETRNDRRAGQDHLGSLGANQSG